VAKEKVKEIQAGFGGGGGIRRSSAANKNLLRNATLPDFLLAVAELAVKPSKTKSRQIKRNLHSYGHRTATKKPPPPCFHIQIPWHHSSFRNSSRLNPDWSNMAKSVPVGMFLPSGTMTSLILPVISFLTKAR
jgi:hypothetical protein